jgi:type II secretory pathway pseudopilin PulG
MIAVAILAIISAIAIPLYEGYITEARYGTAQKDIAQIDLVLNDLALDNDLGALEPTGYAGTTIGVFTDASGQIELGAPVGCLPKATSAPFQYCDPWNQMYQYTRADVGRRDYTVCTPGDPSKSPAEPFCATRTF